MAYKVVSHRVFQCGVGFFPAVDFEGSTFEYKRCVCRDGKDPEAVSR